MVECYGNPGQAKNYATMDLAEYVKSQISLSPGAYFRYRAKFRLLKNFLKPAQGDVVLDAACGPGHYAVNLSDCCKAVCGVDINPPIIEFALEYKKSAGAKNAFFSTGDVSALEFGDAYFDKAFAMDFMEHVADPLKCMGEFNRVLKPAGKLVVFTGFIPESKKRLRRTLLEDDCHGHVSLYSESEFAELAEKSGFAVRKFVVYGQFFMPIARRVVSFVRPAREKMFEEAKYGRPPSPGKALEIKRPNAIGKLFWLLEGSVEMLDPLLFGKRFCRPAGGFALLEKNKELK
ncbi:MAG: methyltransferase domain-containing protein [Candidatus Diapherotrites archaeon]